MGNINLLLSAWSLPPHTQVNLRLQTLLFFGVRRLPAPQRMGHCP
jgi:hypothetical protein